MKWPTLIRRTAAGVSALLPVVLLSVALLALGVATAGLAGCGNRTHSGACKDYQPLDNCDDGYVYECETTDDGCRQCGCVPTNEANRYH